MVCWPGDMHSLRLRRKCHRKKNDSHRRNHLCLVLSLLASLSFLFFFLFLKLLVVSQCPVCFQFSDTSLSFLSRIVYFQLWFARKFFLVPRLSVSHPCVSAALLALSSLHLLSSPPHFISLSVSVKLCFYVLWLPNRSIPTTANTY